MASPRNFGSSPRQRSILLLLFGLVVTGASLPQQTQHNKTNTWDNENVNATLERFLAKEQSNNESIDLATGGRSFMERCGNNNACENGLVCEKVGLGVFSRCVPVKSCLESRAAAFQEKYDMASIQSQAFAAAGITEQEFLDLYKATESREAFALSKPVQSSLDALVALTKEPLEEISVIHRECAMFDSRQNSTNSTEPPVPREVAGYLGFHIELGLLYQATLDIMLSLPTAERPQALYIRGCQGAYLGGGAHVSVIAGFVGPNPNPTIDDVACVSFLAGFDVYAFAGIAFDIGIQINGLGVFEGTTGLGAALGAGVRACGTVIVQRYE